MRNPSADPTNLGCVENKSAMAAEKKKCKDCSYFIPSAKKGRCTSYRRALALKRKEPIFSTPCLPEDPACEFFNLAKEPLLKILRKRGI